MTYTLLSTASGRLYVKYMGVAVPIVTFVRAADGKVAGLGRTASPDGMRIICNATLDELRGLL